MWRLKKIAGVARYEPGVSMGVRLREVTDDM
jgi:hypothetical protein